MRKLYVVNPDGTVMFLNTIKVDKPEKVQETAKVAIHRFWKDRSGEGTMFHPSAQVAR